MYGDDVTLRLTWKAKESLGGFDRTQIKTIKNGQREECVAPFVKYFLYEIIENPTNANNFVINFNIPKGNYFIIEKSSEFDEFGKNKMMIREFNSQELCDEYIIKQQKYETQKKLPEKSPVLLSPEFMHHYYGDSLNDEAETANMIHHNQIHLNNNFYNTSY